jgi:predicted RNA-binding Zn-ribbon protein involved in translation (DUF1610 family)
LVTQRGGSQWQTTIPDGRVQTVNGGLEIDMANLNTAKLVSALAKFIRQCTSCKRLVLKEEAGFASFAQPDSGESEWESARPGIELLNALLSLTNLRHFDYSGTLTEEGATNTAAVSQDQIKQ